MTTKTWFDVDKQGLSKLLERKGKEFILYELIQNAWDTNALVITVSLKAASLKGYSELEVVDDHPEGWKDLTHAWTLYAESEKKGNAEKRGRFNLGEKLVLALCKEARIETTTGGVGFDDEGRHTLRTKRTSGSRFWAVVRMNQEEREAALRAVMKLMPPPGVSTYVNGTPIGSSIPLRVVDATLPTEIADEEGVLRRSARKTKVEIHQPLPGEAGMVFELGIPVVESGGDKYSYNVMQKVPLNSDRDNVTPAYLRELRTLAMNAMYMDLTSEEAVEPWARDAASDEKIEKAAMEHIITQRFGEQRVIMDPSDPEGTKIAVSKGYEVITPGSLSKDEWQNVRKYAVALPAGQVTPSPKPYSPEGKILNEVLPHDWSPGMRRLDEYARWIGREILGTSIMVRIVNDPKWMFRATFGRSGVLTLNLGLLGRSWFEAPYWTSIDELLVHEFGHWYSSDHLSHSFHDALCKVAAALVNLAVAEPARMAMFRVGKP